MASSADAKQIDDVFDDDVPNERLFTDLHLAVLGFRSCSLATDLRNLICSSNSINSLDSQSRSPLYWAAYRADFDAVSLLLAYNNDPNLADYRGVAPLHYAASLKDTRSLVKLLKHQAHLEVVDTWGRNAGYYACEYQDVQNGSAVSVLTMLDQHGIDLRVPDNYGRGGLHRSAVNNNLNAMKLLLEKGSDINQRDDFGKTPLVDSIVNNTHETLRLLYEEGADHSSLYLRSADMTILHFLAQHGHVETLKISTKVRAVDVHALDSRGINASDLLRLERPDAGSELYDALERLIASAEASCSIDSEEESLFEDALEKLET